MIYETTRYATEAEAMAYGEHFKESWGWGYSPSYQVYYHSAVSLWVCFAMRYSSCD